MWRVTPPISGARDTHDSTNCGDTDKGKHRGTIAGRFASVELPALLQLLDMVGEHIAKEKENNALSESGSAVDSDSSRSSRSSSRSSSSSSSCRDSGDGGGEDPPWKPSKEQLQQLCRDADATLDLSRLCALLRKRVKSCCCSPRPEGRAEGETGVPAGEEDGEGGAELKPQCGGEGEGDVVAAVEAGAGCAHCCLSWEEWLAYAAACPPPDGPSLRSLRARCLTVLAQASHLLPLDC